MRCVRCDGGGLVVVRIITAELAARMIELPCPRCRGCGQTFDNENERQEAMSRQEEDGFELSDAVQIETEAVDAL